MSRKGTITENGKKISWQQNENGIKFSDGKIANPSADNMDAKLAYKYPGKIEVPVIITKPSGPREIGNKELKVLKDVESEKFVLKPGEYLDRCDISNLKDVSIDGLGKVLFKTKQRAIQITGNISGLKISGFSTKDIQDYQIVMQDAFTKSYKDGKGDFIDGITLNDIHSDNGGVLFHSNGTVNNGVHLGMIKDFKMFGCSFRNSPNPGMMVYLGNAKNYEIYANVVDNVNRESDVDNGIFMLNGNGKFYRNKATHHQGRLLRSWLYSHDELATVEIFNNAAFDSIKYGPLEIQRTPDQVKNNTKPAKARVYNNTAIRMNTSKDWGSPVLDVYNTWETVEFFNNLGAELNRIDSNGRNVNTGITDMLNNMAGSETPIIRNEGNKYFDNWQDAVKDLTNFESKINGVGASL